MYVTTRIERKIILRREEFSYSEARDKVERNTYIDVEALRIENVT